MDLRHFYKLTEQYLYSGLSKLSREDLEKYLHVTREDLRLENIAEQLFRSLQNKQMYPNIIKFDKNIDQFRKILEDFNCHDILRRYNDSDRLLNEFVDKFNITKPQNTKSAWSMYAKSIISAASFLSTFNSGEEFNVFVKRFSLNDISEAALPLLLEKEIFGLGFSLACDFLKELGYTNYSKPDVHIKDIFKSLEISDGSDYDTFKKIIMISRSASATAYRVDKMLWLICSGNYYLHDMKINSSRKDFINFCLENS